MFLKDGDLSVSCSEWEWAGGIFGTCSPTLSSRCPLGQSAVTLSRSEGQACPPGPLCGYLGTRVLCCSFRELASSRWCPLWVPCSLRYPSHQATASLQPYLRFPGRSYMESSSICLLLWGLEICSWIGQKSIRFTNVFFDMRSRESWGTNVLGIAFGGHRETEGDLLSWWPL